MLTDRIRAMLEACDRGGSPFPPTVLYNENWLLRLVLDWFAEHPDSAASGHPLAPVLGASWFSEGLLPSAFLPRYKGDMLAESRTHADGVIGHLNIARRGSTDVSLRPDATQFAVVEAKIYGKLSPGVKNAPFFDQAARSVACLAEVLRRSDRTPQDMNALGFYLVAPGARIDEGTFDELLDSRSIRRKVQARIEPYAGSLDPWFRSWFEPTLARLDVRVFGWEDLLEAIGFEDMEAGQVLDSFYGRCLRYNRAQRNAAPERQPLPAWACPSPRKEAGRPVADPRQ